MRKAFVNQVSAVLVGQTIQPGVLSVGWLADQKIIPGGWKILQPLITPVMSQLSFENGVNIMVDGSRVQIVQNMQEGKETESPVFDVMTKLCKTVPMGPVLKTGVNFHVVAERPEADKFIVMRLITSASKSDWFGMPNGGGVSLVYPMNEGRLIIAMNSGEATKNSKPPEKYAALICSANFNHEHKDKVTPLSREEILATYESPEKRLALFKKYLHQTLDIDF